MKTLKNNLKAILLTGLAFASCSKNDDDNNIPVIEDLTGIEIVSYNDIQGFFDENGVEKQDFILDGTAGGTIVAENGTQINFYANSFVDGNGDPITGDVDVSIKEIFNASEMILSNKPTNAINELDENTFLLSEGETEVFVSQNGDEVFLAPGYSYQITVPSAGGEDFDMLPFSGTTSDEEGIVWETNNFGDNGGIYYDAVAPATYIYNAFDIGWTNCDKFYSYPGDKTTNYMNLSDSPNATETVIYLVFKENNLPAVVKFTTPYTNGIQSYEDMLPVGLDVTYVAITINNNQQYMAVQDVTIATEEELTLNFEPKTTQEIIDALEMLD